MSSRLAPLASTACQHRRPPHRRPHARTQTLTLSPPPAPSRPDAILGVALFKELVPNSFGRFNLAFVAMFRVAAGETWIEGLPLIDEVGDINWRAGVYVCSYLVINVWVILQVCSHLAQFGNEGCFSYS